MLQRGLPALVLSLAILASACGRKEAPSGGKASGGAAPPSAAGKGAAAPAAGGDLVTDKALVDGRLVTVEHSKWDIGQTADLFDPDPGTLARTAKANPAIIEIDFPDPRPLKGVMLKMGGAGFRVVATVQPAGGGAPRTYTKEFPDPTLDPELDLDFDGDLGPAESIRVEVFALRPGDGHIHIRTLRLR